MMGNSKYFLFLLFLFSVVIASAQEVRVQMPSKEILLEDLMVQLEEKYDVLFSYKQTDVEGVKVTPPRKKQKLNAFLSVTLENSGLQFEIVNNRYVLLSQRALIGTSRPEKEEESLLYLCGQVKDHLTGEPLLTANVYLKDAQKGTVTLGDGSFKLNVSMADKLDTLIISYVGYEEQRLSVQQLSQRPCSTILLDYFNFDDNFLIVTEYLTDGILLGDNGTYTQLQPDKIGTLPGQAEPDVLSMIQFLPGVSSQDGTPSGISVQGGTPDQNLILWEGIPIYHSAHYFGMLSAFNPFIIDKMSVYTGGFGAEYGGRISSVIRLESEMYEHEKPEIGLGTNFMSSFVDGQLASKNNKLTAVFSFRRSMTELWRSPAFNNITKRVQQGILLQNVDLNRLPAGIQIDDEFSFFDTNVKLSYQLSDKDELSLAGFYATTDFEDAIFDDQRRQTQSDTFLLDNKGVNLSWQHQWHDKFYTKLSILRTDYEYDYGYSLLTKGEVVPDKIGHKNSYIQEQQIHLFNQYQNRKNQTLKLGYQLTNYDAGFDISTINIDDGTGRSVFSSNLHVLYTDFETNKEKDFGVKIGLRLSYYEQISQQYIEPRLRLWYNFEDHLKVYFSTGKYYQYLSQLIQVKGDKASIETPVWGLAGSEEVPVLDANHYQLGAIYSKNTWLIDVQAYAKNVNGLTSLASGFDEGLSNRYHLGEATIRGVDLLIKKRWGRYKSWWSYSLKKINYHFDTFFDTDFSAAIEQPHSFQWANMWTFGRFECSLGWKISSGRPFSDLANFEVRLTPPNTMGPRETVFPVNRAFNTERLPVEHQMDASILYKFEALKNSRTKGMIGLSLYNIYHQRNIYNRELYIDKRPNVAPVLRYNDKVDMGFTPNFLLRIEW